MIEWFEDLAVGMRFKGGKARARSCITSTSTPPAPNRMTGPNWRSTELPTINSNPRIVIIG